jgi:hypothetical protein
MVPFPEEISQPTQHNAMRDNALEGVDGKIKKLN